MKRKIMFCVCILFVIIQFTSLTVLAAEKTYPLHEAVGNNDIARVKNIVKFSPNMINQVAPNKSTPLSLAIFLNRYEIIKFLIENGADVNKRGNKYGEVPLHLAMFCKKPIRYRVANMLIAKGAKVNMKSKHHDTPIIFKAVWQNDTKMIKILVSKGADINAKNDLGWTPLYVAERRIGQRRQSAALLKRLGAKSLPKKK